MKNISDLTVEEAIKELQAPEVGPRLTHNGLITHLFIIAMSIVKEGDEKRIQDKADAFKFLSELLENGSLDDKSLVRAYFSR